MCFIKRILLAGLLLVGLGTNSRAVILLETADPTHNTMAPGGTLTNSGWQWQGLWIGYLGTPIGPNHFIAAKHISGTVGATFKYGGVSHTTTARYNDAASDLTIWEVTPAFRNWAQLYGANDEAGKRFVVFGRGTQRGDAVQTGLFTSTLKGWRWGTYDGVMRWGENTVADVLDADGNVVAATLANGTVLRAHFDANGGPNEAALSVGDSSGAIFIQDGTEWKLAGINYSVDGPYNTSSSGAGFNAAIFDEGGLYTGGDGKWALTPDLPSNQPGSFYISRISARAEWIRSIIGEPGLPPDAPILEYATDLNGVFAEDSAAMFDSARMEIRTPNTAEQRFFRVRADEEIEIVGLRRDGADIVLSCRYR